jgi:lysophospholipase L1-like esterase
VLVSNRGIGAEVIDDVLARLDTALDAPRAVFLLIGTNDLGNGARAEEVVARAKRLCQAITERLDGAPLFVQSVLPRAASYAAEVAVLRREYRRLVETLPNAHFVDLVPVLGTPDGTLRTDLSEDRLHLNGDGYRAWVQVLEPLVAEISGRPAREKRLS